MITCEIGLIGGLMLGFEFPNLEGVDDIKAMFVLDLLVFRVVITKWKEA